MLLVVISSIATAAASCCRWTAGGACSSTESDECTELHEYIERKTTTHVFADISGCLGSDQTQWRWQFDGSTAGLNVSGSNGTHSVPTPLKVTHAASCSSAAPILSLQLDTVVVGKLIVGGMDVGAMLLNMLCPSPRRTPPRLLRRRLRRRHRRPRPCPRLRRLRRLRRPYQLRCR